MQSNCCCYKQCFIHHFSAKLPFWNKINKKSRPFVRGIGLCWTMTETSMDVCESLPYTKCTCHSVSFFCHTPSFSGCHVAPLYSHSKMNSLLIVSYWFRFFTFVLPFFQRNDVQQNADFLQRLFCCLNFVLCTCTGACVYRNIPSTSKESNINNSTSHRYPPFNINCTEFSNWNISYFVIPKKIN